jgi:hypothetical protein|tara:strand:- start:3155 stop:3412 length:258 start_codon:yes stop_codon:yes gene_type:complete
MAFSGRPALADARISDRGNDHRRLCPFSKKCGLYVDPGAIAAHAKEIASLNLKATRTGVTFSASKPIPDDLVEKLAVSSRGEKGF